MVPRKLAFRPIWGERLFVFAVMIINNKNRYFKYTITDEDFADVGGWAEGETTKACLKAIDKYLENELSKAKPQN